VESQEEKEQQRQPVYSFESKPAKVFRRALTGRQLELRTEQEEEGGRGEM